MDAWQLMRAMGKHPFALLLMLTTTIWATVFVGSGAGAAYSSSGAFLIIAQPLPPHIDRTTLPHNGYASNLSGTAQALAIVLEDTAMRKSLVAAGLSDKYEVQTSNRSPVVNVVATADSPVKAVSTVQEVIKRFAKELDTRQAAIKIPPRLRILVQRLNREIGVTPTASAAVRSRVATFGGGLLLTVLITAALEGRRRRRRIPDETESHTAALASAYRTMMDEREALLSEQRLLRRAAKIGPPPEERDEVGSVGVR